MPRAPSRSILTRSIGPRKRDTCSPSVFALSQWKHHSARNIATSGARRDDDEALPQPPQRWQAPPPGMTAPFRARRPTLYPNDFSVNEDPTLLDDTYKKVLGRGGHNLLPDEVKWLAVTHKSFDHGRRGYNDRLAFLGTITWRGYEATC